MEQKEPAPAPYSTLDAWRGLAALWVVMHHACAPAIGVNYPGLTTSPLYRISFLGTLGVPIFFVISGYCIASAAYGSLVKPKPLQHFARARLRRLYPPYAIATALTVCLSLIMGRLVAAGLFRGSSIAQINFWRQDAMYYLSALTLMQVPLGETPVLPVFWSLSYEVSFYIIVAMFMCVAFRLRRSPILFPLLHLMTAISLIWLIAWPSRCPFPLPFWPQFGIGISIYDQVLHPKCAAAKYIFAVFILLTAFFGLTYRGEGTPGPMMIGSGSVFAAAMAVLFLLLHRFDRQLSKWRLIRCFEWIGVFSYSLYLVHLLPLGFVSQIGKLIKPREFTYWLTYLCQILAAIVAGRLFFVFCERPFLGRRRLRSVQGVEKINDALRA